jgi:hypothetical protein
MQTLEKAFRFKRRKDKEELQKPLPGQPAPEPQKPGPQVDGENTVFMAKQQAEQKVENAIIIDNSSNE